VSWGPRNVFSVYIGAKYSATAPIEKGRREEKFAGLRRLQAS
jgi:hypothetical protein